VARLLRAATGVDDLDGCFRPTPLSLGRFGSLSVTGTSGRILWETWLIGHGGTARPRTILEGAQIWNQSRLGPSIEGASPCESS
jgi:hypothetical protein